MQALSALQREVVKHGNTIHMYINDFVVVVVAVLLLLLLLFCCCCFVVVVVVVVVLLLLLLVFFYFWYANDLPRDELYCLLNQGPL